MASPPPSSSASPPSAAPLALPRQRPTLALPGHTSSRRPAVVSASSSVTSSAHPLRQTSFPGGPDNTRAHSLEAQHEAASAAARQFSPSQASQADGSGDDAFSDSEIVSAISGVGGGGGGEDGAPGSASKKRKRGEKKPRGRPSKASQQAQSQHGRAGSASLVNGERGGRGDTVGATGSGGEEDDEDEELAGGPGGGRAPLYAGGEMSAQEFLADNLAKAAFRNYMEALDRLPLTSKHPSRAGMTVRDMAERYDVQYRAKLHKSDVRRLVNQTLSQSVPGNVVLVVSAYTKMFAMDLIGEARRVQEEWMGVEKQRADGSSNPAYKKLKRAEDEQTMEERENEEPKSSPSADTNGDVMKTDSSPTQPDTQTQSQSQTETQEEPLYPGGAGGLQSAFEECDRGPLLPDHLREALRRYKKARAGGTVGFTGHSLEGREVAAPRMGGRRLFR